MKYTVRQATPTGKVDPTFGTEYIVHFNEDDREVRLSKKDAVVAGQEMNGTINSNKYGAYFKKDPFVPGTPSASPSPAPSQPEHSSQFTYSPKKDNSDGMRQGMCINNAANYVNAGVVAGDKPLTYQEWAKEVHGYATALYLLGDLSDVAETVAGVFGANG